MGKLENKKNHDHLFVDCIKYGILGLVLCAPLFSVLAKTCYVTFNKNAIDSYSDRMVESQVALTSTSQLIENQTYIFNYKEYITTTYEYTPYITYNSINIDWSDYTTSDTANVKAFRIRTNDNFMQLRNSDNTTINLFNVWGMTLNTFTINFNNADYVSTKQLYNLTITGMYYNQTTLDDAFYYAIEELNEQPVFNWTKNTGMYTVIDGMTTGLELGSNNVLALLLTYWVMNVLIFSIFNIILMVFDKIWCIFYKE